MVMTCNKHVYEITSGLFPDVEANHQALLVAACVDSVPQAVLGQHKHTAIIGKNRSNDGIML